MIEKCKNFRIKFIDTIRYRLKKQKIMNLEEEVIIVEEFLPF